MKTVFVDANVFLRFFTEDDEGQQKRAAALLRKASAGKLMLLTGPPVLFEIAWTLRAVYNRPREEVLDVLERIAGLPGLRLTDADLVEEAISLARKTGEDFADAYIAVSARAACADDVATFNRKHLKRLGANLHAF